MGSSTASATAEESLDALFGALSDRTRRAMLVRLLRAPAMVTELAEPFAMSLPAVSKHLRVMERAGIVKRKIDGRAHLCSIRPESLEKAEEWLACHRSFWEGTLESLADFVAPKRTWRRTRKKGR